MEERSRNNDEDEAEEEDEESIHRIDEYNRQQRAKDDYLEKKQMIEYEKQNAINLENAKQTASYAKTKVKTELISLLTLMKDNLTPEFVNRMRYKKQYPAKIAASEE